MFLYVARALELGDILKEEKRLRDPSTSPSRVCLQTQIEATCNLQKL